MNGEETCEFTPTEARLIIIQQSFVGYLTVMPPKRKRQCSGQAAGVEEELAALRKELAAQQKKQQQRLECPITLVCPPANAAN